MYVLYIYIYKQNTITQVENISKAQALTGVSSKLQGTANSAKGRRASLADRDSSNSADNSVVALGAIQVCHYIYSDTYIQCCSRNVYRSALCLFVCTLYVCRQCE